ncbi:MAG: hypothetical protein R3B47_10115 [Bacteroidia bacterium]
MRELIRWEDYDAVQVENNRHAGPCDLYRHQNENQQRDHVPVTGLLYVPKNLSGKAPVVVYVDGRGKKGGSLRRWRHRKGICSGFGQNRAFH